MNKQCGLYCLSDFIFCLFIVPPFSEEGRQQTADHAAEEETLQESNHSGLQDFGCGSYQYGRGSARCLRWGFAFNHLVSCFIVSCLISLEKRVILHWQWLTRLLVSAHHVSLARERERQRERESHIILDDSCSSHILLCEIMGHLELASYALSLKTVHSAMRYMNNGLRADIMPTVDLH